MLSGQGAVATPGLAAAAANSYLSAAGVDGTATVTGPETVQVAVTTTYSVYDIGNVIFF